MQRKHVLTRIGALIALVLSIFVGVTGSSAADEQSASSDRPVELVAPLRGNLAATNTGNFAYYRFAYPGGGRIVSVNLDVGPEIPTVFLNTGFRVYGPRPGRIYATSGIQPGLKPNITADLVSDDAGWYVVQVYNYGAQVPVGFTIWTVGLPAMPVAAAAEAPTPVIAPATSLPPAGPAATDPQSNTAERAVALTRDLSGHLDAGTGGRFAYYRFKYTAGNTATINLRVTPNDPAILADVGFRVYGPSLGYVYATSGVQPGLAFNISGDLNSGESGEYIVQVFNYSPNTPIDFTISGTGIPRRPVESIPETDPAATPVALPGATGVPR